MVPTELSYLREHVHYNTLTLHTCMLGIGIGGAGNRATAL